MSVAEIDEDMVDMVRCPSIINDTQSPVTKCGGWGQDPTLPGRWNVVANFFLYLDNSNKSRRNHKLWVD